MSHSTAWGARSFEHSVNRMKSMASTFFNCFRVQWTPWLRVHFQELTLLIVRIQMASPGASNLNHPRVSFKT